MLILVCSKDYQQVVYYLQFIYTYMEMTTTTNKFVDQFSRITISSYDDTLRATRKCTHDDFYNVQNCYYGHDSKLRAPNYPPVLSNSVSSYHIALGTTKTIERLNTVLLYCLQFVSRLL